MRGQFAATTSEEETACRRQPGLRHGCRVHAALSADAEAAVVGGMRSGSFRCGRLQLALRARVADKSYVILAKQRSIANQAVRPDMATKIFSTMGTTNDLEFTEGTTGLVEPITL